MAANVDFYPVRPSTQVSKSWLEAQQNFALSLSTLLQGVPSFLDLTSTSAFATDGTWGSVGNPTSAGSQHSGALALGGFTEAAFIFPASQANSGGGYIKTPRHGMWFVACRSCVATFATNAGSRQTLAALSNTVDTVAVGYVPSVSATNWTLWTDSSGTIGASVVTSEPRRQSSTPDRDFDLFFDGVSVKAYTGDLLAGLAMSQIAELTATEGITDGVGRVPVGHVRTVVESGTTANYDKLSAIGVMNR